MSLMLLSLVNLLFDLGRSEEHAQKQRKVEALYYAEQTAEPLLEGADRNRNADSRKQSTQNQADRRVVSSDTGILVGRNGTRTHSSLGALKKENPDTVAWLSFFWSRMPMAAFLSKNRQICKRPERIS